MNLLSLLLNGLTSQNSINATSKKTGVSSKLTSKLLMMAIPMLISYMTKNASKKDGAQSLLGALTQHKSNDTVSNQIANADTVDGAKIIGHILGGDQSAIINNLAKESGATTAEVNSILNSIAPALLNSLSTATTSISNKKNSGKVDLSGGIDLTDVLGLLSGSKQESTPTNDLGNLLGLLGNKKSQNDGNELLSLLLQSIK